MKYKISTSQIPIRLAQSCVEKELYPNEIFYAPSECSSALLGRFLLYLVILKKWIKEYTFYVFYGKLSTYMRNTSKKHSKLRNLPFKGTIAIVFLIGSLCRSYCEVLYVPGEYETIQDAVDNAADDDTIRIAEGEYNEHISILENPQNLSFFGSEDGETIWSFDGGRPPSILSSQLSPIIIANITFRDSPGLIKGVYISRSFGSIINCNFGPNLDRGVVIVGGSGMISNCVFNNLSTGVDSRVSDSLRVEKSIFIHNTLEGIFTGIAGEVRLHFENNIFDECDRCIVTGSNTRETDGTAIIRNNIFNESRLCIWYIGGYVPEADIDSLLAARHLISYNLFFNTEENFLTSMGSDQGFYEGPFEPRPGDGLLFEDPLFQDIESPFLYYLDSESPCIDAGDPDSPEDPDGSRCDMGMIPFNHDNQAPEIIERLPESDDTTVWVGDTLEFRVTVYDLDSDLFGFLWVINEDSSFWGSDSLRLIFPEITDHTISLTVTDGYLCAKTHWNLEIRENSVDAEEPVPVSFTLLPPYPNPFNSRVFVPISVSKPAPFSLTVFDISGRTVIKPLIINSGSGRFIYPLDLSDVPTGQYYIRIQDSEHKCSIEITNQR